MCIGETLDSIGAAELEALRLAARGDLPAHAFEVHANAEGLAWVVLEPPASRVDLLRVTICRIAPCLMVMVEDAAGRRQICSTGDPSQAMAFARSAADGAVLAAMNAHPAHRVVQ